MRPGRLPDTDVTDGPSAGRRAGDTMLRRATPPSWSAAAGRRRRAVVVSAPLPARSITAPGPVRATPT